MALVKLVDICAKIGSGATPRGGKEAYCDEGISLVRSQNVLDFAFTRDGLAHITEEQAKKLDNVELKFDDVLLNITGDSVARVCMMDAEYLPARVNQHVAIIRGMSDKVLNSYLLYFLQWRKEYLLQLASAGATRNALTKGMIEQLEINLPTLEQQEKVVSVLNQLQERIKNNRRINNNLEQQAVTLFRSWFSTFDYSTTAPVKSPFGDIPSDFKIIKTGELDMTVTDYVANGSFASLKENVTLFQEKSYAYFIRNTDLKSGSYEVFVDKHSYDFLSKSTLYGGEIIISNVGDVGSVFLCPTLDQPMTLGNNIIMLRPKQEEMKYYLYVWFKWLQGQALIQGIKGGSAQPKFNKTDFKNLPIMVPSHVALLKYHNTVAPMFELISLNDQENIRLKKLRDSLLPRLMSGELDVSNIDL